MRGVPGRFLATLFGVGVLLAAGTVPARAGRVPRPRAAWDGEYRGWVAVVDGIERPDLVVRPGDGRAPGDERTAIRRARRALRRRRRRAGAAGPRLLPVAPAHQHGRLSRRFLRRHAVVTRLLVVDDAETPVAGARVFRYTDPSFYAVNTGEDGARLFGAWRYLPWSYPAMDAIGDAALHLGYWRDRGFAPVAALPPDGDWRAAFFTPGVRPVPQPPLEYVGRTDDAGVLEATCGIFALRDRKRFPRAVVPTAIRVGYVVLAPGYLPAFTERRFVAGGVRERRTVHLLRAPDAPLFTSIAWKATCRLADGMRLAGRAPADVLAEIDRLVRRLAPELARVPGEVREATRRRARARLLDRLVRRAGPGLRAPLARAALDATPGDPSRAFRLAVALAPAAVAGQVPWGRGLDAGEREARGILEDVVRRRPRFLPAFPALDRLLRLAGEAEDVRRAHLERMLREAPFDPWARGRVGATLLRRGRAVEAFDHLRYARIEEPGLGGDEELGRALAAHWWRLGLPEKAGFYAFLLGGTVPEAPAVRPRGGLP